MPRHHRPQAAIALALLTVCTPVLAQPSGQPGEPQTDTNAPSDFWHRDTMTGDWGGLRTELADHGIGFSATYTAEVMANVQGGIHRGASYMGLLVPKVDVDLEKLLGWEDASFRVAMLQGHGPSLSQGWVGDLLGVSGNDTVPPATRLRDLWLQQNLFDDVVSVRAGIMVVDDEFIVSPTAGLFMNGTFGWPSWAGIDLPAGGPATPFPAPGVRVRIKQPGDNGLSLQAAIFSGDPTGHNGSNSPDIGLPSGTVVSFRGGAFLTAELGYAMNHAKDDKGSPALFKLGAWYHTSNQFQDQRFATDGLSLADPLSTGIPRNHSGDWGIYGVVDASLYQAENGGGLSGFARVAGSPGDRNAISFYVDGGLAYQGLIPGRDNDTAGFAVAYARIGNNLRGLDQDTRSFSNPLFPIQNQEVALELTYQVQVTPWMTLQPGIQYVFNPGGNVLNQDGSMRRNALVLGLQSALTF